MKVTSIPNTNNKAIVITNGGETILQSYNTEVAKYDEVNGKMEVYGVFSATTLKHLKLFLESHNYPKMTKKEIIEKFNLTENI